MDFKGNLKKFRTSKLLSQPELAMLIGARRDIIEELETGIIDPDEDIVSKLAIYFRVTIVELFMGVDEE